MVILINFLSPFPCAEVCGKIDRLIQIRLRRLGLYLNPDPPADREDGKCHENGAGGAGTIRRAALRLKGI